MNPKPYYNRDGITLYHGDTLSVLHSLASEIHAVITDPPYCSGSRVEAKRTTSGAMLRGQKWAAKPIENDQMTTTGFIWLIRQVCYAVIGKMTQGASLLSFIDWRQWPQLVGAVETTNLRLNQMIVWDKGSFGLGNGFRSQHELVLHASKGTPRITNRSTGNVLDVKRDKPVDHPSPKPVELMSRLVQVVTAKGDLIVDPFAGSGSTLLAARNLGRRAIGVEIDEAHCETVVRRLAA
jgi:DNA modification methylase